ncbi:MAG: hypothetical protein CMP55_05380 [Flavobacteriales bacterium]|nr:hypothetical protein [Flavobacteriales bacterium]|tara:strand:- start:20808 stop:21500 length:693 start_codon:yes stop_codon:yes gene_type:complete
MPSKNKLLKQKEKEEQKEKAEEEKLLNEYWNEGTNKRGEKKAQMEHEKQMEKMQKLKEKKELEEAENANIQSTNTKVKKTKKKKGDDFELLNEALKNAPKTKAQKEAEQKQQEKLQKLAELERVNAKLKQEKELLEKEKQKNMQKGMVYEHDNIMDMEVHNTLEEDEEVITGLDNILSSFSTEDSVSFNKFYHQQLPIMKKEYPGLRLTQYQQKIHVLWKKSPLNKNNQI